MVRINPIEGSPLSKTRMLMIAAVFCIVLVSGVACVLWYRHHQSGLGSLPPPPPGMPIYKVGDSWKLAINETEYNLTMTVTGEESVLDVGCYVMKLTFEPESPWAEEGMEKEMKAWLDRSTLRIVKIEGHGESQGYPFTYVEEHSYIFQGGKPSITIGNEYGEIHNKTSYAIVGHLLRTKYPLDRLTTTTRIKVEAVEYVRVKAGNFSCYRIVTYDETGQNALSATWFSMEAKTAVRSENYETGETSELISYSI